MAALEQNHSPAGLEAAELQQEVERLRGAQVRTERALEARERAHRQRVRGLEEQVRGFSVRKLSQERGGSGSGRVSLPLAPFWLRCSGVSITEMVGVDPGWCQPWLHTGARVRPLELSPLSMALRLGRLSREWRSWPQDNLATHSPGGSRRRFP